MLSIIGSLQSETWNLAFNNTSILCIRDVGETISWMKEKEALLDTDDYGFDVGSVQALQRRHEGIERDLAALEEKVNISYIYHPFGEC